MFSLLKAWLKENFSTLGSYRIKLPVRDTDLRYEVEAVFATNGGWFYPTTEWRLVAVYTTLKGAQGYIAAQQAGKIPKNTRYIYPDDK